MRASALARRYAGLIAIFSFSPLILSACSSGPAPLPVPIPVEAEAPVVPEEVEVPMVPEAVSVADVGGCPPHLAALAGFE